MAQSENMMLFLGLPMTPVDPLTCGFSLLSLQNSQIQPDSNRRQDSLPVESSSPLQVS